MPYNEDLANRIRNYCRGKKGISERKMFGGVCFMVNGNMACGVERNNLVIRVGPDKYEEALKNPFARPMDFTGRPLKGFIYVVPEGYKSIATLRKWIGSGVNFAKALPSRLR